MKKLTITLGLFLYSFFTYSQIVSIPDSNFLAALIEDGVDTNGDGLIQVSEAEAVTEIDIKGSAITSLEGINEFKNLVLLFASKNNLISVDVDLPNLFYLGCEENQLTSIELSDLPKLQQLYVGKNNLTSIDISKLPLLDRLNLTNNELTTLDISHNPLISYLKFAYNNVSEIDVRMLPLLTDIGFAFNNISKLDLRSNPLLKTVLCVDNGLDSLMFGYHPALHIISCSDNNITELKLDSLPALKTLTCGENRIFELDVSKNPLLETLNFTQNYLTEIDLSNNPNLIVLACAQNRLTSINVTNLTKLGSFSFGSTYLQYVNMRDNNFPWLNPFWNIPNLKYLCADSSEVEILSQEIDLSNVIINEYCPENYKSYVNVNGTSYFDSGSDCADGVSVSNSVELEVELASGKTFVFFPTNESHSFKIPPNEQSTIRINNIDTDLFTIEPEFHEVNSDVDIESLDFCITPAAVSASNICLNSYTLEQPFAGFDHTYTIDLINLGNIPSDGLIRFKYDQEIMEFKEASDSWTNQNGILELTYFDLSPLERRTPTLTFSLNSPMDDHPLFGGEELSVNCIVIANEEDIDPENNRITIKETVVNSYDPNDKTCLSGDVILKDSLNSPINYRIRFENTGTAPARNITIIDTIDTSIFDLNTFQILRSSFPVNYSIKENSVTFEFVNINLPIEDDSNDGFVIFALNTISTLGVGTKIQNKASIFFDFNWPIYTNVALSELVEDIDEDGFNNLDDCDDENSDVNPDALEIPYNGLDDDCDAMTLDDDLDQDGFGIDEDCNDMNNDINPDAEEEPYNGIDEDCDSSTLDDDLDEDGFNLENDCDDMNPDINPDADEIANNGVDEDCDGADLITSIHELSEAKIKVFPNPAVDLIVIDIKGQLLYQTSLYNNHGKLITSTRNTKSIDVNSISHGIYLLVITDLNTGKKIIEKIIVGR